MKKNLTYILGVLFLMTSCIQVNFDDVAVNPGDEVSFSAALYRSATKTVYGAEADNKVPVYWVNNDTITVYGAKCVEGRNQANYTISTVNSDGTVGTNMDYALSINRVGAYGVQWGTEASDFYAIYPAAKGEFGTDGNSNVTVTTTVREGQKNMFKKVNNVWVGTPYIEDKNNPTMRDALMYAYTPATATSASKSVDLKFHPFTTVLKFKLEGFDGQVFDNTGLKAYVTKIVVTAPDYIAGDCTFTFTNGQPTASNGTSNKITIYPDYLPLEKNDDVEFYVFAIPYKGMQISEDWSVTVETSNLGTFTYKIKPLKSDNNLNKTADLTPGKIHKITVPKKTITLTGEVTLPPTKWVEFIPRNVYLSELSIPGAWCCYPYSNGDVGTSEQYQQNATIAAQYAAGVRAFHIDCRITNGELVVAGTEEAPQGYANISVESAIRSIATQLTNKKEYVVVVLSVAEKPYRSNSSVNPSQVLSAINDMVYTLIDGTETDAPIDVYKGDIVGTRIVNDKTYNIYKGVDANTTVNDVAGKIIIKINANTNALGNFFGPALISEASLATSPDTSNGIVEGSFNSMNSSQMFWGAESAGLTFYYHHGQGTGLSGQPSMDERKIALKEIVQTSDQVYNSGKHNAWFQMGIGGFKKTGGWQLGSSYIGGSDKPSEVAKALNPEVLNLITAKLNGQNDTSPSPIGIVLMNFSTQTSDTYKSDDLIDAIIRMNNAFILNRNPEFAEWPDGVNPYDALFGTSGASTTSMYATIEPLN